MTASIPRGDASASSIELWRTCRLQFKKIRRQGRGRERVESDPMTIGKLCHEVFEAAYHAVKGATDPTDKVVELPVLEKLLDEVIATREPAPKANEKTNGKPGKPTKKPKRVISSDMRESALEIIAMAAPLDLVRTVQVEVPWSVQTSYGEIVGVDDRVDEIVDTTTGEVEGIEIVDYKTGGRVVSDYDLPKKVQTQLYLIAARDKSPEAKKLQLRMYWVARDEWSQPVIWSKAYDEAARRSIESDLREMTQAAGWRSCGKPCDFECGGTCDMAFDHDGRCHCGTNTDPYPPTVGTHCDDCAFRFECPAYRGEIQRATDPAVIQKIKSIEPSDLATPVLLRTRQKLKIAEELFLGLRKAYDAEIKDRIPDGEWSLTSADLIARVASRGSYNLMPPDELVQFLMPILATEQVELTTVLPDGSQGVPVMTTQPINPDAEVTTTERDLWLASISSVDKKKLTKAIADLPKDERKKAQRLLKDRRQKTGESSWIEVTDVERPF